MKKFSIDDIRKICYHYKKILNTEFLKHVSWVIAVVIDIHLEQTNFHRITNESPESCKKWSSSKSHEGSTCKILYNTNNSSNKRLVKKIYDAVALCEYLMWLDKNVALGKVDEISGLKYLSDLRLAQPKSKGLSFGGISAVGPNAAIIHYG